MQNEFNLTHYLEEARGRVTEQFIGAPVFDKYLQLLVADSVELQLVLKDLMEKRSLNTAEGVQLDILGDIVGQPRTLIDADLLTFFGFEGEWQADSYGNIYDPAVGSAWRDGRASRIGNITLTDDLYRLLIKAKIAKNVTRATPEDIMTFSNFVFNTNGSNIVEEGAAKFRLMIGRNLTREEVALLRYINTTASYESILLPKPIGVGMVYGSFDYEQFFGFQGVPNVKGYGAFTYTHFFNGTFVGDGSVVPSLTMLLDVNGNPYDPSPQYECKFEAMFAFDGIEGATGFGTYSSIGEVVDGGNWNRVIGREVIPQVCTIIEREVDITPGDGKVFGGKWASYHDNITDR